MTLDKHKIAYFLYKCSLYIYLNTNVKQMCLTIMDKLHEQSISLIQINLILTQKNFDHKFIFRGDTLLSISFVCLYNEEKNKHITFDFILLSAFSIFFIKISCVCVVNNCGIVIL